MSLLVRGGRIVDPAQGLDRMADLLLERGRVARIGRLRAKKSWRVLEVRGCLVTPGLVDMHVHLREPGGEAKETVKSGLQAAAAGGFTRVMCMPNTDPVNDCAPLTRFLLERASQVRGARLSVAGAITRGSRGEELAGIGEMVEAGVVAITDDGHPVRNAQIMRRALEYSRQFDIPVIDHCENPDLAAGGCLNEGRVAVRLGLPGLSRAAEELDVTRDLILARLTGGRVHIAHISTRESLNWVRLAKEEGIRLTCEVTPHHFLLSEEEMRAYDTNFKMKPPLRAPRDVEAMRRGLADGSIDCIASDHAPHTVADKETTFQQAANGIVGLETALPLAWEFLVRREGLAPSRLVELMSLAPSRILRLEGGTLQEGAPGDVTVIDPDREWVVDPARFRSRGRNSPFEGWRLHGVARMTIVGGRIVYRRR